MDPQKSVPWVEKYRPSQFKDIVLDDLNRQLFKNIIDKNYFPNLLFYGPPGTGKTTTVINLINEYQIRYNRKNKSTVIHLNASDERGIDIIRNQINQFARSMNLFETGLKFVILDEIDYMTKNAQQALKYLLETCSHNVRFCLICNYISKIDELLKNEFILVRFNQLPKEKVRVFIQNILEKEKITLSNSAIEDIQNMYNSDIRSMINYIQLHHCAFTSSPSIEYKNDAIDENDCIQDPIWKKTIMSVDVLIEINSRFKHSRYNHVEMMKYIHDISIKFNIDINTIMILYFNYIVRNTDLDDDTKLAFVQMIPHILHNTNIELGPMLTLIRQFYIDRPPE